MAEQDTPKKVIVVVDDDPTIIELYKRMFARKGLEVLVARDGEKGLQMIKDNKPDFVVLDIRMPKLDGLEVLKNVRKDEKVKDTPVLILTNYDLTEYREEVAQLNAVDFLTKVGTDPGALVERVTSFLSSKK